MSIPRITPDRRARLHETLNAAERLVGDLEATADELVHVTHRLTRTPDSARVLERLTTAVRSLTEVCLATIDSDRDGLYGE
jgi:hypothetical protein